MKMLRGNRSLFMCGASLFLAPITCKWMDICLVSLRPQSPLHNLLLHWWRWYVLPHCNNLHPHLLLHLQHPHLNQYHRWVWIQGHHDEVFSWEPRYLYNTNFTNDKFTALCVKTLKDWGTSKNIKIHVFPCTGQICHKPLSADPYTNLFSRQWGRIQERGAWF